MFKITSNCSKVFNITNSEGKLLPSNLGESCVKQGIWKHKRCIGQRKSHHTIKAHRYTNGIWTDEEHNMLLCALEVFGSHWKAIQLFLGTRSSEQIRSHVQKHFQTVRRNAIKKLKRSKQLKGKIFVVIKQYKNYPYRCVLTQEDIQQVAELKQKWFSSQENLSNIPKVEERKKPDFELPPLGNLSHEDMQCEYLQEIEKLEKNPSSPWAQFSYLNDTVKLMSEEEPHFENPFNDFNINIETQRQFDCDNFLGDSEFHGL
jgi:SHAQKYF class myb-like DNA-binding protein